MRTAITAAVSAAITLAAVVLADDYHKCTFNGFNPSDE